MKGKGEVRIGQGEAWAVAVFAVLANYVSVCMCSEIAIQVCVH